MAPAPAAPLPDYESPPVIEVVCGLHFKPLKLLLPHFGLLWEEFKSEYPRFQEATTLVPTVERFNGSGSQQTIEAAALPLPRVWLVSTDETYIVQIQRDFFLHNWKKVQPSSAYPHYPEVMRLFRDRLGRFKEFLTRNTLGSIEPIQYELTYVNHLLKGEGWASVGQIGQVFPDFGWRFDDKRFLPEPEGMGLRASFVLPERLGRLHAVIRTAKRLSDGQPLVTMELTARGFPGPHDEESMYAFFDVGHEWIVRGFADLTSAELQVRRWRRK